MKKPVRKSEDLRSRQWFDNAGDPGMTALYLERYLNYGLTPEEMQSGRPIIGIAQSGSDLAPCNRHHLVLADRIRDGIREAGGIPIEFPVFPIQETGRRPTAALDRNLQCITLIEVLHGYPLDGVILTTGCDKTTPALLMGAASMDLPAIAFSAGPMLNGNYLGQCVGSGSVIWDMRQKLAKGEIDYKGFMAMAAGSAPSTGHCNTMGTALTMNSLAEALGMTLPGSASIPAPYRERQQDAFYTGKRIVEMVWEDLKPSDVLTLEAFENAITVCSALGGSTNAPIHINAVAAHIGITIDMPLWQRVGHRVPQIVNCQPVGEYLAEEFHKAGGVPAVISELLKADLIHKNTLTVTGRTIGENYQDSYVIDQKVIKSVSNPVRENAGFLVLSGNIFDAAVMKVTAISPEFRQRYLSNANTPNAFEARAIVFEGPEDYHERLDDLALNIDENCILIMRGAGPIGFPGSAEVVNMQPPKHLLDRGILDLPTLGDGRQSGTSGSPSILNVAPEAAAGGKIAILETGDILRIDLNTCRVDVLIDDAEIAKRVSNLSFSIPSSQTWWQETYRQNVSGLDSGAIFPNMVKYKQIRKNTPRHSH